MADAIDLGLVATGGLIPGWELAQAFAPGGFDPNFYRNQNTGSFPITTNGTFFGNFNSNVLVGGIGDDYITGYGYGFQEIDILAGNFGADRFALGDPLDVFYHGPSVGIIADYNYLEGDVIQLSALGVGNYYQNYGNLLGGSAADTFIYYGNDVIGVVADTTDIVFDFI